MATVSCILATKNRPEFLSLAIRMFLAQTFTDSELIIIDDSARSYAALVPDNRRIGYIHLLEPMSLGAKLNYGISISASRIIQKIDDDDYYHPLFLQTMVERLQSQLSSIVAIGSLTVLMLRSGRLHDAGVGWFAGGTLCFFRTAWETVGFRDVPRRVDVYFLEDHPELKRASVDAPHLYVLVRHGAHAWTRLVYEVVVPVKTETDADVDDHLESYPTLGESLEEFFGGDIAAQYRTIMKSVAGKA